MVRFFGPSCTGGME